MVTRLRPLDVNLAFEDRLYKLGETIDLYLDLTARRELEVREGRVDLVCEERWAERFTVMAKVVTPLGTGGGVMSGGGSVRVITQTVPRQVYKEHKETYVHSSVVFLQDIRLDPAGTGRYDARLEIQPEPPPHADGANLRWSLVATIDVAGARDIKTRRKVKVTLA